MALNTDLLKNKTVAPLHFVTKDDGVFYSMAHAESTVQFKPHEVLIADARPLVEELHLERNGFTLSRHDTKVTNFLDEGQIKEIYLPEIERFICAITGASFAKVFGSASRSEGGEATGGRQPGRHAHCDYSVASYRIWGERTFGQVEAAKLFERHWAVINVWRGIRPVESAPLAICDASTVKTENLRQVPIYPRPGEPATGLYGHPLEFAEEQRWYYFPLMAPEEVLTFKQYDSRAGRLQWGAHCAFDHPDTAPEAIPRSSFEVRALVFFDEFQSDPVA